MNLTRFMTVLAEGEATTETPPNSGLAMLVSLAPILLIVVLMYFVMIRPQRKQQKKEQQMRNSLRVGDEITTIGGIVGTICAVKEETIVIETGADRVRIEFTKWAVSSKGTQGTQDAAPAPEKKEKDKKDDSGKEK